jgi:hypothetical protein
MSGVLNLPICDRRSVQQSFDKWLDNAVPGYSSWGCRRGEIKDARLVLGGDSNSIIADIQQSALSQVSSIEP